MNGHEILIQLDFDNPDSQFFNSTPLWDKLLLDTKAKFPNGRSRRVFLFFTSFEKFEQYFFFFY